MNTSGKILIIACFYLIFCSAYARESEAKTFKNMDGRWAFVFENCTVPEALVQISLNTGIQIFINREITRKIHRKSYIDSEIAHIIMDILRKDSCMIVWDYEEDWLDAVYIWVAEGSRNRGTLNKPTLQNRSRANIKENNTRKNNNDGFQIVQRGSFKGFSKEKGYMDKPEVSVSPEFNNSGATSSGFKGSGISVGISERGAGTRQDQKDATILGSVSASEGTDTVIEQPIARKMLPVPKKWHGLEPPPMPPGF